MITDQNEPTSYQEAISSLDSEKWLEAMKSEMQSMYNNQVEPERLVPSGTSRSRAEPGQFCPGWIKLLFFQFKIIFLHF